MFGRNDKLFIFIFTIVSSSGQGRVQKFSSEGSESTTNMTMFFFLFFSLFLEIQRGVLGSNCLFH